MSGPYGTSMSEIGEAMLRVQRENHARGVLLGRILQRCYDTSYKDKGHVCANRQTVESIVQMIEAHNKAGMARNAPESPV